MVFNHGNSAVNEDHFGVPMIMASHGYFVVSPNHIDGSSLYAINENGIEVWYDPAEGEDMVHKNDKGKTEANMKFWDNADRTLTKRVNSIH